MAFHAERRLRGAAARRFQVCTATAVLFATACGAPAPDPTGSAQFAVVDDAGRTVSLERPARRVISLIPAQTEITALLAGPEVLIARTQWDHDPRLAHLPSIGNALTPSVEWLAAQRPDLIIAWPDAQSRDVVQRLSDIGIPVYASRVESIGEIRSMIRRLGVLLDASQRAEQLIQGLDAQLDSVRARVAGRPRPRVLYLLSVDPPTVAGPGTFVDQIIEVAGGDNVFGDLRQLWPQVSLEDLVRRQPDVIIRPLERGVRQPLSGMTGRPGWRELRAVRDGRVYGVDPDLFNRAGVTVGTAARGMAEFIHPAAFSPADQGADGAGAAGAGPAKAGARREARPGADTMAKPR